MAQRWFDQAYPDSAPAATPRGAAACTALRVKLRPDILLLRGLTPAELDALPALPADARQRCTVYIFEVGYAHEHSYAEALPAKRQQHLLLVKLLHHAGWRVHEGKPHTVLLGSVRVQNAYLHLGALFYQECTNTTGFYLLPVGRLLTHIILLHNISRRIHARHTYSLQLLLHQHATSIAQICCDINTP